MKKKDPSENGSQLGNLIERYKRILQPPQASIEKEFIQVVTETVGIQLLAHQVSYTVSNKTIYIKAPSILRSELLLHKVEILKVLKEKLGEQASPTTIL